LVRFFLNSNTTEVTVRISGGNDLTEGPAYSRDITIGDKKGIPETLIANGIVTATEQLPLKAAATVVMKATKL
jgi:hypothetical protein